MSVARPIITSLMVLVLSFVAVIVNQDGDSFTPSERVEEVLSTSSDVQESQSFVEIDEDEEAKELIESIIGDENAKFKAEHLLYPNASTIAITEYSAKLESVDFPDTITDWYKDQIRNNGFNVKSFVTTSTNGNFVGKLKASDSTNSVSVDVVRSVSDIKTNIEIQLLNE